MKKPKDKKAPSPADVKAKADKAEAKAKTAPKAQTAKAPKKTDNEDQERALFLHNLPKISDLKAKVAKATADLRNAYKQAKADGFVKADFDEAFKMQGEEGEKVKKAAIARSLRIAKWLGLDLGTQLDMFMQDERVPAADRSFEEGKSQAMLGISLKCDYAPETEQYRKFAEGWHAGQAVLAAGIKPLHPAVAEDEKDKAEKKAKTDAAKAEDAKAFEAPASGVAMTRAEFKAQQEAQAAAGKPN